MRSSFLCLSVLHIIVTSAKLASQRHDVTVEDKHSRPFHRVQRNVNHNQPAVGDVRTVDQRSNNDDTERGSDVKRGDDVTATELHALVERQAASLQELETRLATQDATIRQLQATVQAQGGSFTTRLDNMDSRQATQTASVQALVTRVDAHDAMLTASQSGGNASAPGGEGTITWLEGAVTSLNDSVEGLADRLAVQERQVGFSVGMLSRNGHSYTLNIPSGMPIIFDHVQHNYGGGYDLTSGKFRAPSGGLYLFYVHYQASSSGGVSLGIYSPDSLTGSGLACAAFAEDHDTDSNDQATCSVPLLLDQGDVVFVKVSHGEPYVWSSYLYFGGVLVHPQ